MTPAATDVVVVGGGIAGLVTAYEMTRLGRMPLVLESGEQFGGCVSRHTVGGIELDAGAESFATATPALSDLIADLGLTGRVVAPNPGGAWVLNDRGAAPLPAGALLGIPSRPLARDARRAVGPAGSVRAALDLVLPGRFGAGQETLGGLVRARMGASVVRRLVEPVAGGVYSTDPDELDANAVSPRLATTLREKGSLHAAVQTIRNSSARPGALVGGIRGGMFTLVDALVAAIEGAGGTVEHSSSVESFTQSGRGFDVVIAGMTAPVHAESVILAVPGAVAASLLAGSGISAAPPMGTSEVTLVTMVIDDPRLDAAPRGTGVLVSRYAAGVTAKALTHATAKWAWLAEAAGESRHVLRLSYGRGDSGLPSPEVSPELALRDAGVLMGMDLSDADLIAHDVVTWSAALPRPQVGQREVVAALRSSLPPGLLLTGSFLAGTGLAAVVSDARSTAAQTHGHLGDTTASPGSDARATAARTPSRLGHTTTAAKGS